MRGREREQPTQNPLVIFLHLLLSSSKHALSERKQGARGLDLTSFNFQLFLPCFPKEKRVNVPVFPPPPPPLLLPLCSANAHSGLMTCVAQSHVEEEEEETLFFYRRRLLLFPKRLHSPSLLLLSSSYSLFCFA